MVLWACPTVACLEPYTPFRVFPGETGVWRIDYELLIRKRPPKLRLRGFL